MIKCFIVLIIWLAIGFKGGMNLRKEVLNPDKPKRINFALIAFFAIVWLFIFPMLLLDDRGVVSEEDEWLMINIANFIKSL